MSFCKHPSRSLPLPPSKRPIPAFYKFLSPPDPPSEWVPPALQSKGDSASWSDVSFSREKVPALKAFLFNPRPPCKPLPIAPGAVPFPPKAPACRHQLPLWPGSSPLPRPPLLICPPPSAGPRFLLPRCSKLSTPPFFSHIHRPWNSTFCLTLSFLGKRPAFKVPQFFPPPRQVHPLHAPAISRDVVFRGLTPGGPKGRPPPPADKRPLSCMVPNPPTPPDAGHPSHPTRGPFEVQAQASRFNLFQQFFPCPVSLPLGPCATPEPLFATHVFGKNTRACIPDVSPRTMESGFLSLSGSLFMFSVKGQTGRWALAWTPPVSCLSFGPASNETRSWNVTGAVGIAHTSLPTFACPSSSFRYDPISANCSTLPFARSLTFCAPADTPSKVLFLHNHFFFSRSRSPLYVGGPGTQPFDLLFHVPKPAKTTTPANFPSPVVFHRADHSSCAPRACCPQPP